MLRRSCKSSTGLARDRRSPATGHAVELQRDRGVRRSAGSIGLDDNLGSDRRRRRRHFECSDELERPYEDIVEHRFGQALRERVLLARVERAQQRRPTVERNLDAVAELRAWPNSEVRRRRLVAKPTEAHDDPHPSERREFPDEERCARIPLDRQRLVRRRRALHGRGHPRVCQCEAVVDGHRPGLVGEAGPEHRPEQPVAAAVTGEHATRPVRPMSGRGQPEHDDPGALVAETRNWATPVLIVAVGRALFDSDPLAPLDEAGACPAGHDIAFQAAERAHADRQ